MIKWFKNWRIKRRKAALEREIARQDAHYAMTEQPFYIPSYQVHDPMGPPMPIPHPMDVPSARYKRQLSENTTLPAPEPDDDDDSIVETAVEIGLDLLANGIAAGVGDSGSHDGEDWQGDGGESAGGGASGGW